MSDSTITTGCSSILLVSRHRKNEPSLDIEDAPKTRAILRRQQEPTLPWEPTFHSELPPKTIAAFREKMQGVFACRPISSRPTPPQRADPLMQPRPFEPQLGRRTRDIPLVAVQGRLDPVAFHGL